MKQSIWKSFLAILLFLTAIIAAPALKAQAEVTAAAVSIGTIDYDKLTMVVNTNGNSVVYFSTDKKNWYEVEGEKDTDNKTYEMDISWVPSTADKTIYFKGDVDTTVITVTLPAKDTSVKVTFNKADGDFTFTNCDTSEYFEWRKSTDYTWYKVSLDTNSDTYKAFMLTVENMLAKGAKIVIRIPQTLGKDALNTGERPSKEINVTLTKRANAPSVAVNASKLNLNTTTKLEYYSESDKAWIDCEKSMSIADIAPSVLYENGAKTVTLQIRTAATSSKSYSKSAYITISGQAAAPSLLTKSSDISYYYENNKFCMVFGSASKTNIYSYCIVKPGASDYDVSKVVWKQVKDTNVKKLTQSAVPEGSVIYVRKQGINANGNKGISLVISSKEAEIKVNYPSDASK